MLSFGHMPFLFWLQVLLLRPQVVLFNRGCVLLASRGFFSDRRCFSVDRMCVGLAAGATHTHITVDNECTAAGVSVHCDKRGSRGRKNYILLLIINKYIPANN